MLGENMKSGGPTERQVWRKRTWDAQPSEQMRHPHGDPAFAIRDLTHEGHLKVSGNLSVLFVLHLQKKYKKNENRLSTACLKYFLAGVVRGQRY